MGEPKGAGKRWGADTRSEPHGVYSRAYCDERDAVVADVEALRRSGAVPLDRLVRLARDRYRRAWQHELRRVRGG